MKGNYLKVPVVKTLILPVALVVEPADSAVFVSSDTPPTDTSILIAK